MKVALAILLLSLAPPVFAINLAVTSSEYVGDDIKYFILISNWTKYDNSLTNCGGKGGYWWRGNFCHIQIYYRTDTGQTVAATDWVLEASQPIITVGMMVGALAYKGIYVPGTKIILAPRNINIKCIGLQHYNYDYNATTQEYPQDLASCVPIKLPPVACDLNGDTKISHKIIADNAINGAQASTQLYFVCKGSSNATIKATRTNSYGVRLRGDDSLYSEVKINGKDATDGINVQITSDLGTPINITSILKARGAVAPGPFEGSTVVTVSPH